jgi:hypothetical protein
MGDVKVPEEHLLRRIFLTRFVELGVETFIVFIKILWMLAYWNPNILMAIYIILIGYHI